MARWVFRVTEVEGALALGAQLGLTAPAARVLWARGYRDPAAAGRFLHPSFDALHDPFLLHDMEAAASRLRRAIGAREKVLVYGDYDVDGTTSVVILTKAIELAGGVCSWHVPHRLLDGYGMRPEVVEKAAADGVTLIVSVDTGIRAAEVVARANELGIDVIVTDHHLPEAALPPALAILNPNRADCTYPDKNLCGVGVAFKLIQALLATLDWPAAKVRRVAESFLKLVAIGTVADVVPLTGENRVLVKLGLDGLRTVKNPGLRAILNVAGFTGGLVPNSRQIAFQIAPRINAAGRMDTARAVVELFLTGDADHARDLAQQLHEQNAERQHVEAEVRDLCASAQPEAGDAALVFCGDGWHRGVLGIVASRMVERFHRPSFVLSTGAEDGLAQGSGRSIPAFHLLEALESMPELFLKFGGHQHAAGLTMEAARVPEFRKRFNAWAAARLTPEDFIPQLEIDAAVEPGDITEEAANDVFALAPFGHGNPAPVFAATNVEVASVQPLGEKHLKVTVRQNSHTLALKAWNFAARSAELAPGARLDVAFVVEEDPWSAARGFPPWCATLRDIRIGNGTATS
jgi:single-stranded-DNA-specific exonuclease